MASAVPDMDTIPLLTKSAESSRDSGDGSQDGLLRPNISSFTEAEVDAFVRLAEFVAPNPRKLKRITNLYLLCRLLLPDEASGLTGDMRVEESWIKLRDRLLAWLILCEQWPMRMCWILQVLQDNQQPTG